MAFVSSPSLGINGLDGMWNRQSRSSTLLTLQQDSFRSVRVRARARKAKLTTSPRFNNTRARVIARIRSEGSFGSLEAILADNRLISSAEPRRIRSQKNHVFGASAVYIRN